MSLFGGTLTTPPNEWNSISDFYDYQDVNENYHTFYGVEPGNYTLIMYEYNGNIGDLHKEWVSVTSYSGGVSNIDENDCVTIVPGEPFSIKANSFIALSLPVGTSYEIEEIEKPGFELVESENTSGVVTSSMPEAKFTNVYSAEGHLTLQVQKELIGDDLVDDQFSFNLIDNEGNIIDTAKNKSNGTVEFAQMDFDQNNAGSHYVFYMEEINDAQTILDGNNISRKIIYDNHTAKVEFDVINDGSAELQVIPEYSNQGFTNRVLSDITISNTVKGNGGDVDKEFDFTVTIDNLTGTYQTVDQDLTPGTIVLTNGEGHISLSHGESITIKDIPVGTDYEVSEASYDDYTTTSSGSSGTIILDGAEASFINAKSIEIPTGVRENIKIIYYLIALAFMSLTSIIVFKKRKK
jgi:hypothetical protein